MIDLHTHSIFSDGELIPAELIRRAEHIGYAGLAITDHADMSNIDLIIPRIVAVCAWCNRFTNVKALPGIELTHIPPEAIPDMATKARDLGAVVVVVHGETLAEPVASGTNRAALESDIDILAHPGLLMEEDARLAAHRGIFLELSTRRGHCLSNGHVARMAKRCGAGLVINTDAHSPNDLVTMGTARGIALGAGLEEGEIEALLINAARIMEKGLHTAMKGQNG